jgi:hypothetical protein
MAALTWQLLLAPRGSPNAAGRAARCHAAPCAASQQRAAALRRLCASPDEASASLRSSSAERIVSFDEFLVRNGSAAQRLLTCMRRLTPPDAPACATAQAPPGSGVFEAGDDDEEEPWERSEQLLRIAASTRSDTRTCTHALPHRTPLLTRRHAAVIKRALPSDAASASVLSAYAPEQGTRP